MLWTELNFLKKKKPANACSISFQSGSRGLQRLTFLKYFNALGNGKVDSVKGWTLQNNMEDINKCFKWKLFEMEFPTKNSVNVYPYHPHEWSYGPPKIATFKIF